MLQRKGMAIATVLPKAARQFCLLSYWLTSGFGYFPVAFLYSLRFARGFPIAFGHFPAAFLYSFSSAQRVYNSL
jgi:hypothetical protein